MGHKTRWQARFDGYDGETEWDTPWAKLPRHVRNIKRSQQVTDEVRDEDQRISRVLGLRVR